MRIRKEVPEWRKPRYVCRHCKRPYSRTKGGICGPCWVRPSQPLTPVVTVDLEKLKIGLRKEGIPIDEILRKAARNFRRRLRTR